jgi:hypothetical protein
MKRWRFWRLIGLAVLVSFQVWHHPVFAKTALSDMLLIPGDAPVRIKLPDTSQSIAVSSLRPIPPRALRAAQRITRHTSPHPYYWAGFVLTGMP